ncbi:15859_t:CDS:1 [Funneliformis mosseae]|uniref:Phosphatidylglycerol/phosphatidylinositol transfer protein n=1 Tax=Funneliformis mosseae TaxID=27381 RepID=A0A9N9AJN6_FUNMO|nr:15859_t:CDS:1 [Funneliformis mosseae]
MKNFIVATIILAMISMVNAKTEFVPCVFCYPVPILPIITFTPDPVVAGKPANFTIKTVLDKDVTTGDKFVVAFVQSGISPIFEPTAVDICSEKKCPIKALTLIDMTTSVTIPADLPKEYSIMVFISDHNDPMNQSPLACGICTEGNCGSDN